MAEIGFTNPIVGGGGELVIDNIHSRGYIAGSSGWYIGRDGDAEFQNVSMRGVFTAVDGNNEVRISPVNAPWTFSPAISLNPNRFYFAPGLLQGVDTFGTQSVGHTLLRSPYPINPETLAQEGQPSEVTLISDTRNTGTGRRVEINADTVQLLAGCLLEILGGNLHMTGDLSVTGSMGMSGNLVMDGHALIAGNLSANNIQAGNDVFGTGASVSSVSKAVIFPHPFDVEPKVMVNIASGTGSVSRWSCRAISVTTTGFTFFAYAPTTATSTPLNVEFQWLAVDI